MNRKGMAGVSVSRAGKSPRTRARSLQTVMKRASVEDTAAALIENAKRDVDDAIETAEFMRKKTVSRVDKARKNADKAEDPEMHQDIKNHIKVLEQNVTYWENVVKFLENVKKGQEVIAEEAKAQNEQAAPEEAREEAAPASEEKAGTPEASEVAETPKAEEEKTADSEAVESENMNSNPNRSMTDEEADVLLSQMEDNATDMPHLELTPSNWVSQFGEDGTVNTPIGLVKMGDNQIAKLFERGRSEQFGMIKPTLESPQVVIEVPSESNDGNTERNSSLLFIKTFIGKNGDKIYYFKSVTVKKDGLEVSVSSHYDRAKRVKDALKNGRLLYRFNGGAQTEHLPADVSVTTSQENGQGLSSEDKVTESAAPAQTEEENSSSTADAKKRVKKRAEAAERLNVEIDK